MAEKVIKAEVFGDSTQALISKAGTPYIKSTLVTKDENGNIAEFINACFFPEGDGLQQLRGYLCKGRIVEVTGNYTEREYTGKDGTPKTAHDILVHNVRLGGVAEYEGGQKTTDYSFISDKEKAVADAQNKQAAQRAAKKPAQPKTKVSAPGELPNTDVKKGAKTAAEAVLGGDDDDDFYDLSDIEM